MSEQRKRTTLISAVVIVSCIIMAIVDGIIKPPYAVKSAAKLVLFLVVPFICSKIDREIKLGSLFRANKKGIKLAFSLCIPVFAIILVAYAAFRNVFDFSMITSALTRDIGVNKDNFVFVATYIAFVNSLLEEFFFRGFAFLSLANSASKRYAYVFSAGAFALYHIAMMTGWFSIAVFALALVGLFAGGVIFNYLNDKSGNIYTSWLVHMFANFAINLIGFHLFGII